MSNSGYHHWGCTSIYRPLSKPLQIREGKHSCLELSFSVRSKHFWFWFEDQYYKNHLVCPSVLLWNFLENIFYQMLLKIDVSNFMHAHQLLVCLVLISKPIFRKIYIFFKSECLINPNLLRGYGFSFQQHSKPIFLAQEDNHFFSTF